MKCKLLSLSIALFFVQPALAATGVSEPQACPTTAAIKAVGVNIVSETGILGWAGINLKNTYNTPDEWTFVIFGIKAQDENDAIAKANNAIGTLSLFDGPKSVKENEWDCIYTSQNEDAEYYMAIAETPPVNPEGLVSRFRQ